VGDIVHAFKKAQGFWLDGGVFVDMVVEKLEEKRGVVEEVCQHVVFLFDKFLKVDDKEVFGFYKGHAEKIGGAFFCLFFEVLTNIEGNTVEEIKKDLEEMISMDIAYLSIESEDKDGRGQAFFFAYGHSIEKVFDKVDVVVFFVGSKDLAFFSETEYLSVREGDCIAFKNLKDGVHCLTAEVFLFFGLFSYEGEALKNPSDLEEKVFFLGVDACDNLMTKGLEKAYVFLKPAKELFDILNRWHGGFVDLVHFVDEEGKDVWLCLEDAIKPFPRYFGKGWKVFCWNSYIGLVGEFNDENGFRDGFYFFEKIGR
jgi:hypothetical protein